MLAVFSLRLAAGLMGCLLLLPARLVRPPFYRTHFLVTLGLAALAAVSAPAEGPAWARGLLIAGAGLAFVGSLVWSLEGAPGGMTLVVATLAVLFAGLGLVEGPSSRPTGLVLLGDCTSAALLGSALTAMLMGHSYLIAPSMALTPLLRLLGVLGVAVLARAAVEGYGLWCWTAGAGSLKLNSDTFLWLPVRWGLGFAGPLLLGWMAWQAARIRSTQSSTGILYVVVIFCFLGELTGLLLRTSGMTF